MKNHIAAIDHAIENNLQASWKKLGFNSTFWVACLYSLVAGNDLPNYDEVIETLTSMRFLRLPQNRQHRVHH